MLKIEASSVIKAPADIVYGIIADYRAGHPGILPRQYFPLLEVEHGGKGAGTRIRFQMRVGSAIRTFQAEVSEPEPGRVLVESNHDANDPSSTSVTTFTVEPIAEGQHSKVTITTEMTVHSGLTGVMEKLFAPSMIRKVYLQELSNLEASAIARAAGLRAKSATA